MVLKRNDSEVPDSGPRPRPTRPTGDARRIRGYLGGDAGAFAEIESWVRTELWRQYPRLRGEHADLLQTVHGKLLVNLRADRFQHRSSLRTYVTGIVHRTAIDRLRELYRERALTESMPGGRGPEADNPYLPLEALDERRQLHQVLLSLPENCRELWRLVFVEKLGYEEIGKRLSIPPGTVKSRMWHCRRKAREALERMRRIAKRGPRVAGPRVHRG